MDTIGLIAAMSSESKALLRKIKQTRQIRVGTFKKTSFHIADHDCVLVTSGIGVKRAAAAARHLIELHHPVYLISFGIAGAVRKDLQIGDVIMATLNCTLEKSLLDSFQPLSGLTDSTRQAVKRALEIHRARFLSGTAITTRGNQLAVEQSRELANPILEMETAGILQASKESNTPIVVIRSISDGPLAPLPLELEKVMDEENNFLPGRLILAVLKDPRLLFRSGQMLKNSRMAADNAALAVITVLNQVLPVSVSPP